jgi:hypothetical protein
MIILPRTSINRMNTNLDIGFYSGDKLLSTEETSFMGPIKEKTK